MGVPSFFRWLGYRYPSIITYAYEKKQIDQSNDTQPMMMNNTLEPNPNGVEFDNLYLDMNGIIHPCCHPEEKLAPQSLEDMIQAIFEYIDRIFNIVRPRKLLYMAIDGVAPRAKMNQQRSRRFRSAIESIDNNKNMEKLRQQLVDKGYKLAEKKEFQFDNNCITPGTEFMYYLSDKLDQHIKHKITTDPGWKNIHVILSDANAPGEGEHKIMDFIRRQRNSNGYDPNTRHCLNGADADLIMLGLATHELHFTILREEFIPNRPKPCSLCEQYGHLKDDCMGILTDEHGNTINEGVPPELANVKFLFVSLSILREYLQRELYFYPDELNFEYSFERCVDDWIFLCFFVGNDFLPHLPSLEIRENAIDRLVKLYKELLPRLDGYVTSNGFLNVENVQKLLKRLGNDEDAIFKERQRRKVQYETRIQEDNSRKRKIDDGNQSWRDNLDQNNNTNKRSDDAVTSHSYFKLQTPQTLRQNKLSAFLVPSSNQPQAELLRQQQDVIDKKDSNNVSTIADESLISSNNSNIVVTTNDSTVVITDNGDIELHKEGWRSRYYSQKFGMSELDSDYNNFRNNIVSHYVQGLSWVLQYYYQGCPSWSWYYPFHYSPFASDCIDIINTNVYFPKNTKPFKPMEQLMAVFPANSKEFLPKSWQKLMNDPLSEIIDFYPTNFMIDLNGKKFSWQGVALLPFIDEKRLLNALDNVVHDLSDYELERNSLTNDRLYFSVKNSIYKFIVEETQRSSSPLKSINLIASECGNMSGQVHFEENSKEINSAGIIEVVCLKYLSVEYDNDFVFDANILPGVIEPEPILKSLEYNNNVSDINSRRSYIPKLTLPGNVLPKTNPYRLDLTATSNIIRHHTTNIESNTQYNPRLKYTSNDRSYSHTYLRSHRDRYQPYNSTNISNNNHPQPYPHIQGHFNPQGTNYNNDNYYSHQPPRSHYAHQNRFAAVDVRPSKSNTNRNSRPYDPRRQPNHRYQ